MFCIECGLPNCVPEGACVHCGEEAGYALRSARVAEARIPRAAAGRPLRSADYGLNTGVALWGSQGRRSSRDQVRGSRPWLSPVDVVGALASLPFRPEQAPVALAADRDTAIFCAACRLPNVLAFGACVHCGKEAGYLSQLVGSSIAAKKSA